MSEMCVPKNIKTW